MKESVQSLKKLVAPCGMNCAICSRYLAYVNKLKRSQCPGCRPGNKKCTYLFAKCSGINSPRKGNATAPFCVTCDQYPCKQIDRMDARYRTNFGMSVKDNLERIDKKGIAAFVREQRDKYRCSKCGNLISVHNGTCFKCDTVTNLIEKRG